IVSPPMNQYVMPLSVHSIPYVAMKGGSFSSVIISPFNTPTSAPKPTPVATPIAMDPDDFIAVAARQADRPTFAPTDRSRPAVRMVSVSPDAIRNVRLAWRKTFNRFADVRNTSVANASAALIATTATSRYARDFMQPAHHGAGDARTLARSSRSRARR